MSMTTLSTICAWCLDEQGEEAQTGDSHGICEEHARQIQGQFQWACLQSRPAYVERFASGRETWEETNV